MGLYEALEVYILLNLIDIITTRIGLSSGAVECNPIARAVLKALGVVGLYVFKLVLSGLLILVYYLFMPSELETVVWVWNILLGAVVAWNSYINARYSRERKRDKSDR